MLIVPFEKTFFFIKTWQLHSLGGGRADMTRFARARGSKSSNERTPEEATSWQDMRQQLKDTEHKKSQLREQANKPKLDVKSLLQVEDFKTTHWAEFENVEKQKKSKKHRKTKETKHNNLLTDTKNKTMDNNDSLEDKSKINNGKVGKSKKKKLGKELKQNILLGLNHSENNLDIKIDSQTNLNFKKEKNNKNNYVSKEFQSDDIKIPIKNIPQSNSNLYNKNKKKKNAERAENFEKQHNEIDTKNQTRRKNKISREVKIKNKVPYKRRKTDDKSITMFFNGKEIKVIKFDGFPVKQEDYDRLIKLRKLLIDKGIPKSEMLSTMKLERRRAEKSLAREKKKVCFHCRKSGHILSECPELISAPGEDAAGTGLCFKCGSTEHTHLECRVTRKQEFRHAKCFVCEEQGHIARQCPNNPRGLYPNGGGCKICGDVTHLRRDCPQQIQAKEEQNITISTLNSTSLEMIDGEDKIKTHKKSNKSKQNKIIKF